MRLPCAKGCPIGSSKGDLVGDGVNWTCDGGVEDNTMGLPCCTTDIAVDVTAMLGLPSCRMGTAPACANTGVRHDASDAGDEACRLDEMDTGDANGGGGISLDSTALKWGGKCGDSIGGMFALGAPCRSTFGDCSGGGDAAVEAADMKIPPPTNRG
mmetsp:Transcript_67203/g.190102  ORF Transcript_67203/g.190102 Transcript_67203/m.190102 type:complete len:156 (+) Transcript_67203:359-826(+)